VTDQTVHQFRQYFTPPTSC